MGSRRGTNDMRIILDITNDHVERRRNTMDGNPLDFVMGKSAELIREAQSAKSDPSRLVLASHFAVELERGLMQTGIKILAPPEVFRGNATSAIIAALREWESINQEYENQLKPAAQLPDGEKK